MKSLVLRLNDIALQSRRVLIRADFNVPIKHGRITSTTRIDAALGTIRFCMDAGAKVMLMSHIGRPHEYISLDGASQKKPAHGLSLAPVANYLGNVLNCEVALCTDYLQHPPQPATKKIIMLENVRFNIGEANNDQRLARKIASLCDVFVMDAFGTAHRAHASTTGVAHYAQQVCAGPLLMAELDALENALGCEMKKARRPLLAIVGGAKVSSKLAVLEALSVRVDKLIPGGGIANTFLKAAGHNIGKSLHEPDLVDAARRIMAVADTRGTRIPLPTDVVVAKEFADHAKASVKSVRQVADDDLILDIGPETIQTYADIIKSAGTILWNGPLGAFEMEQFANGTAVLSNAIAESQAYSIAGGGDTLAAIEQFNLASKISRISTGGGAFLAWLEGKKLPAVAALASGGST